MPHRIVEEELELLARVRARLEEASTAAAPSESSILKELEYLRELLVEGGEEKDRAAITQQYDRQAALLKQLRTSREARQVDPHSPYFGHLRLAENGEEWDLCIGKATRIERDVRVVDWRNAPISRIYYRYRQGDTFEEDIAGRSREGRVTARRSVTIRDAVLTRIDAPEGTFSADAKALGGWREERAEPSRLAGGEGTALRVYQASGTTRRLGTHPSGERQRADKHLPDIAGLIDPDQFRLITRPSSGMVVIRGTAGSGKTTVALHRIAYLAYQDEGFDSNRTLCIVFSTGLRNYVSHVLPALGVTRVQVRTFHDWVREQRRRLLPALPAGSRNLAPRVVQRLKVHPVMLRVLEEQVRRVSAAASPRQVIDDWGSALSQAELLERVVAEVAPEAFAGGELRQAAEWNRKRHEEITAYLKGDGEEDLQLDAEDDALLLRAWQLRAGRLAGKDGQPLSYRHITIDEVQDFSPLEVRVLVDCLDPQRSMTLAGDTQQHVMQDAGFSSWNEFFRHLGVEGTAVDTLRVAYRSTQEIVSFAMQVLGDLREDDTPPLTTRSGPPVELFRFTDHGACVAFLADALKALADEEPLASVALLTPSVSLSELYHRGLASSEVPRVRRIENQEFSFAPGVEVTEIEQVKGLEFDYVVLVDVTSTHFPDTPATRRLLHVGATRAVHQLWLTSVGTPSPLVQGAGRLTS